MYLYIIFVIYKNVTTWKKNLLTINVGLVLIPIIVGIRGVVHV
jgi:hypothetical protein